MYVFILKSAPPGTGIILRQKQKKVEDGIDLGNYGNRTGNEHDYGVESDEENDYVDDYGNDDNLNDEANFDGIDDGKDYEHDKESRRNGNNDENNDGNNDENNDGNNDENNNGNNDEIVGPVGHGGSPIILMRKNPQNRRRRQRDKNPPLTATKKFHQLIVKSPLRVRGDTDQSDDGQLTKEGETMTFYLD